MSYKNIYNLYNESVVGKSYQRNRETLLLELTVNEASIKRFAQQYMEYVIDLDFATPEHAEYLNVYKLSDMLLKFCKENNIALRSKDVADKSADSERISSRKYKKIFKDFAYLVGDISWRNQRQADGDLAQYMLALDAFEPGIWGDAEDDGLGVNESDIFHNILNNDRQAGLWNFLPYQQDKTKMRIRFRYLAESAFNVAKAIMDLFNKRQKVLANKDIFAYKNLFEIVKALATTRSKSELKSVAGDIQNSIKEIKAAILPCNNPNWIVIKPPNHAFSRKYFGITRYSIKEILKIVDRAEQDPANSGEILNEIHSLRKIQGASWCTAANKDTHFKQYIEDQKTELYYFISMQATTPDEELYAIRTIGSYGNLASYNRSMSDHAMYQIADRLTAGLGTEYKKGQQLASMSAIPKSIGPGVHGSWARLTPLDNLDVLLNYDYHFFFDNFMHFAIIETRSTNNRMIDYAYMVDDIGTDWFAKNINFITGIPSISKEEASKAAMDICMQKREASSNNVNKEIVDKFKLK